jgi:hypothetical protein
VGREETWRAAVSKEKVSIDLLCTRVMTMTAEIRDVQLRFGALDHDLLHWKTAAPQSRPG